MTNIDVTIPKHAVDGPQHATHETDTAKVLRPDGNGGVRWASAAGGGDMYKSTYDTDDDGIVDNAEQLGGVAAADYLTEAEHTAIGDAVPHHARYTDAEAVTAILAADGPGSGLDADTVDGQHYTDISNEIDGDISTHAGVSDAHHSRYTDGEAVAAVLAADGPGSTLDADTVDGQHYADISSEIDGDISTHAGVSDAHHSRYTDAEAVAAILAADGPGSGLDADTVDGNEASAFAAASHTHAASDITSGNLAWARLPSGADEWSVNASSAPVIIRTTSNPVSGGSIFEVRSSGQAVRLRVEHNGVVSTQNNNMKVEVASDGSGGYYVWHENNDGPGSGLDADTVDGNEASAFAASTHGSTHDVDAADAIPASSNPGTASAILQTDSSGELELASLIVNSDLWLAATGVLYKDSLGEFRYGVLFPGSDVVALANRVSDGVVQIRANTATAGNGGEVTVAEFADDLVTINTDVDIVGNSRSIFLGKAGESGPLGLNFVNGECYFIYRTTPNQLLVEDGSANELMAWDVDNGRVGIQETSLGAQLHVKQPSTTGGIPVTTLDQQDVDEPVLHIIGTATSGDITGTIVDSTDVSSFAYRGFIKIQVTDEGNQVADQDYYLRIAELLS
jgi:hypothetical protein